MRALLDKLHALAMAGDTQAARLWLDRVLGRVREEPAVAVFDLPDLADAAAIAEAHRRVVVAAAAGELEFGVAERAANLLAKVGEAGAWALLTARVDELERGRAR
ncbi:MAG: hypothetical protein WAT39_19505 [Planctomycetota bacterium]